MPKYIVEYELPFIHRVQVGVQADTPEAACELVTDELCGGDLFTEDRPVLHDIFEEDGNAGVALEPEVRETLRDDQPWPAPDETVKADQREEDAVRACRLLCEAFAEGEITGEAPTWNWLNIAHDAACLALSGQEMGDIRKKVADRLGIDPDDSDPL